MNKKDFFFQNFNYGKCRMFFSAERKKSHKGTFYLTCEIENQDVLCGIKSNTLSKKSTQKTYFLAAF